jgi:hypothetical protein
MGGHVARMSEINPKAYVIISMNPKDSFGLPWCSGKGNIMTDLRRKDLKLQIRFIQLRMGTNGGLLRTRKRTFLFHRRRGGGISWLSGSEGGVWDTKLLWLSKQAASLGYLLIFQYSGRKIIESLGNVTVRGEKDGKSKRGSAIVNSLSEHVCYNWRHLLPTSALRCDTSAAWT